MQNIPEDLRYALKEAKDLLEQGGRDNAQAARDRLLDHPEASEYPIYHYLLAKIAKELNQADMAISHLEKSLELNPNNALALIKVAESKLKKGQNQDARDLLRKAVAVESKSGKSISKICVLLLKSGDVETALNVIKDAHAGSPNDKEVQYTYGLALKQSGDIDGYEAASLEAIKLCTLKDSLKQRISLGKHFLNKGSYGKVMGLLSPLNTLRDSEFPSDKVGDILRVVMAYCHLKNSNYEQARNILIRVSKIESLPVNYVWAMLQLEENDIESAFRSAQAVQELARKISRNLEKKKLHAKEVSSVDRKFEDRAELIESQSADGIQWCIDFSLSTDRADIIKFLDGSYTVFNNMIPA